MFPVTCILLIISGALGLIMDFLLAVEKMKDVDCPKFLAVLVIVFGLAWGIAAILVGISGYSEAKRIILQQRRKRSAARVRPHLSIRQLGSSETALSAKRIPAGFGPTDTGISFVTSPAVT